MKKNHTENNIFENFRNCCPKLNLRRKDTYFMSYHSSYYDVTAYFEQVHNLNEIKNKLTTIPNSRFKLQPVY